MNNHEHKGGGFLNGFLWGLLIGGGLALLFTTKKGRKIIRTVTEGGLESIAEVEDLIEDLEGKEDAEEGFAERSSPRQKAPPHADPPVSESQPGEQIVAKSNGHTQESTASRIASSGRRFFRGIPKRS